MTGGEALANQLQLEGIQHVFGIPGIQMDYAVEGLRRISDKVRYVVPRHEQATSYMADGYARTGGPLAIGTMMVVPGPGLLNAMAGLATAYACNSRVLCITGQIHSSSIDRGLGLLHELPSQDAVLSTVTKWTARAKSAREIPALVREAVSRLRTGAPKPVSLELPHDILSSSDEIDLIEPPEPVSELAQGRMQPDQESLRRAASILRGAKFPLIYAGGGVLASGASEALAKLAECLNAPVVMSDNGKGALPASHPLALNTLGGRALFRHCDTVLVVGSRFIDGMAPVASWPGSDINYVFLNISRRDMTAPRQVTAEVHGDALLGLLALADLLEGCHQPDRTNLITRTRAWAGIQIDAIEPQASWVRALSRGTAQDDVVVHEMTQIGYAARLSFPVEIPGGYLTPGYQGTLGFGFPTALGAAFAKPGSRVISLNGDGGFGWNLQELSTAVKYVLNITIIVFVDGYFGNVRTIQSNLFGENIGVDLLNPDYQLLSQAMGIPYARADSPAAMEAALQQGSQSRKPLFIEARVSQMPSPWHLFKLQAPATGSRSTHIEPPDPVVVA